MAATLNITDGTTTVSLISATGFSVMPPSPPGGSGLDVLSTRSQLSDSRAVNLITHDAVTEVWECRLIATSHDNAASQFQTLQRLLIKAGENQTTNWQTTPVYMTAKTGNESNTRYSKVLQGEVWPLESWLTKPFANASQWRVQLTILREPWWRDTQPGTLPTALTLTQPEAPAQGNLLWVPNHHGSYALTHLYNYDDSAGTFSANLIASTAFSYFPASPAANDLIYFGSTTGPFFNVVLNIGVAGNTNCTYRWEYWSGAAWTDANAAGIVDCYPLGTSGNLLSTGVHVVRFSGAVGWATTAINAVTAYWLRLKIVTFTSWTTSPTQASVAVFTANTEYIELEAADTKGDSNTLLRLLLHAGGGNLLTGGSTTVPFSNWIAIGAKSRGLDNFTSRIPLSGTVIAAEWTSTLGTDTAKSNDRSEATGDRVGCTFATDATLVKRVTMEYADATGVKAKDWEGLYQVYLTCQQSASTAGLAKVRMDVEWGGYLSSVQKSDLKSLTLVNQGKEYVDLGRFRFPPVGSFQVNGGVTGFIIRLYAQGTAAFTLYFYELIFIPIDEWAIVLADLSGQTGSNFDTALWGNARWDVDGGVLEEVAMRRVAAPIAAGSLLNNSYTLVNGLQMRGRPPRIKPGRKTRLFFLFGQYPGTSTSGALIANRGEGALFSAYAHNLWSALRGAD